MMQMKERWRWRDTAVGEKESNLLIRAVRKVPDQYLISTEYMCERKEGKEQNLVKAWQIYLLRTVLSGIWCNLEGM